MQRQADTPPEPIDAEMALLAYLLHKGFEEARIGLAQTERVLLECADRLCAQASAEDEPHDALERCRHALEHARQRDAYFVSKRHDTAERFLAAARELLRGRAQAAPAGVARTNP
ncbi:MAG TPA: hypothetical protein VFU53_04875 [Burkholderiales bacterium]|nr:hypothetical protein [Burkholderiales bacterium]